MADAKGALCAHRWRWLRAGTAPMPTGANTFALRMPRAEAASTALGD
jgi:hypothetical protein